MSQVNNGIILDCVEMVDKDKYDNFSFLNIHIFEKEKGFFSFYTWY